MNVSDIFSINNLSNRYIFSSKSKISINYLWKIEDIEKNNIENSNHRETVYGKLKFL